MVEKIDPDHTDEDFLRDLEKATSDEARKRLGLPSAPDEDRPEHRSRGVPLVVAERVLVQVGLQIAAADRVVDAPDAVLKRPKNPSMVWV